MSNALNPYAPPAASGAPVAPQSYRRVGDTIIIPVVGASLPARCVRCNAPGTHQLSRRLFWHPPGWYFLILVSVLFYVIAALIVRKKAEFSLYLCDRHQARRRAGILIGWVGSLACLLGTFVFISRAPLISVILLLGFFVSMVAGLVLVNVVAARRIDKSQAWLRVGRPFLESFQPD